MNNQNGQINFDALFCDETEDYCIPSEPNPGDIVIIKFRSAKNDIDQVSYIENENNKEVKMNKMDSDDLFDYYGYQMQVKKNPIRYFFQIVKGNNIYYYNRLGVTTDIRSCFSFSVIPGFHTPEWAKGAVMYQIFVDRFCRGDETNDVQSNEYFYIGSPVKRIGDWFKKPDNLDVGSFYGGDLKGVWDKLDYLQQLGVEVIYFNPLFVSPSNHKYDCQDYDHIDPHFGVIINDGGDLISPDATDNKCAAKYVKRSADKENLEASDALFARLVDAIHKRGMKVIIDGVFNHCGSFNKWLDREQIYQKSGEYEPGAYMAEDSPYHSFFRFYEGGSWPCNGNYDGWWGHSTLPKLNYEGSDKLYQYMLDIAAKWLRPPYSVDGWRLDVAADLGHSGAFNHQFWRDFRKVVKGTNPDALILAEHYGDPGTWLQGDQWDTVMNYDAFMEPITWFLTGMEKHSDEYRADLDGNGEAFFEAMNYHMSRMHMSSILTAMNELSNHDHSRFLTRTNKMVGRISTVGVEAAEQDLDYGLFRSGVMIQMTWPGAPTIYYGDEVGVCGWTDPDNRRTYPWGKEDLELLEFHHYMIGLHKHLPALKRGSVKQLIADQNLIVYGRSYKTNKCIVAVNTSDRSKKIQIPVWQMGVIDQQYLQRVMLTEEQGYNVGAVNYTISDGMIEVEIKANSSILLTDMVYWN